VTERVGAYAPGSIGNVGPGFDILGMAIAGRGDTVIVERRAELGVIIKDPGHADLPTDPELHTAAIAAMEVIKRAGAQDEVGIELTVHKGLSLTAGQGGSAASAVAAAVATNGLLHNPLWPTGLVGACLVAEERVSGRCIDNVTASLLGGLVLVRSEQPLEIVKLPVPPNLRMVLALPDYQLETAVGRTCIPDSVPLGIAMHQAAQVGSLVAACYQRDLGLLGRAIDDRIAEPSRAHLLPGFREAKAAALAAGALGVSVSGSGPTAFALAHSESSGESIAEAMANAYRDAGFDCSTRVTHVDHLGARLVPEASVVPQET
jgi:homoserine kinase